LKASVGKEPGQRVSDRKDLAGQHVRGDEVPADVRRQG
jgi:hypothetical protein